MGIPLYKIIADEIKQSIESGEFKAGTRLLSEAALAGQKNVSVGTIKKVYASLERDGCVYKIRGGGAYVTDKMAKGQGQDTRPSAIVTQAVRDLSQNGFKMNRIYSIVQKQSGQVFRGDNRIRAALVDCNPETIHHILGDLEQVSDLDVEAFLLGDLLSGRQVIDSQCNLALVTQKHFGEFVRYADSIHLRTEEISLRETRGTIARLAVIPDWQDICVVYRSSEFLESVRYTLKGLDKRNKLICIEEQNFTEEDEHYISDKLPFIVPPDYINYSGARMLQMINRVKKIGGLLIPFEFEIDKGSFLHLKQVLEKIRTREAGFGI